MSLSFDLVVHDREPRFVIGDGHAVYRGPVTGGTLHRHAAFQIAIGIRDAVIIADEQGTEHRGAALVVPPMQRHCLLAMPEVVTFFVEPHCCFADRLRARGIDGITAAPQWRSLRREDIAAATGASAELDPRLCRALTSMQHNVVPIPALAAQVGLSPQRLRALARQQLGMPLARWRVWSRLRRAAEALQAGESPAAAAVSAGFSDQAHLNRSMREMMGLTPAGVLPLLRGHGLRAT